MWLVLESVCRSFYHQTRRAREKALKDVCLSDWYNNDFYLGVFHKHQTFVDPLQPGVVVVPPRSVIRGADVFDIPVLFMQVRTHIFSTGNLQRMLAVERAFAALFEGVCTAEEACEMLQWSEQCGACWSAPVLRVLARPSMGPAMSEACRLRSASMNHKFVRIMRAVEEMASCVLSMVSNKNPCLAALFEGCLHKVAGFIESEPHVSLGLMLRSMYFHNNTAVTKEMLRLKRSRRLRGSWFDVYHDPTREDVTLELLRNRMKVSRRCALRRSVMTGQRRLSVCLLRSYTHNLPRGEATSALLYPLCSFLRGALALPYWECAEVMEDIVPILEQHRVRFSRHQGEPLQLLSWVNYYNQRCGGKLMRYVTDPRVLEWAIRRLCPKGFKFRFGVETTEPFTLTQKTCDKISHPWQVRWLKEHPELHDMPRRWPMVKCETDEEGVETSRLLQELHGSHPWPAFHHLVRNYHVKTLKYLRATHPLWPLLFTHQTAGGERVHYAAVPPSVFEGDWYDDKTGTSAMSTVPNMFLEWTVNFIGKFTRNCRWFCEWLLVDAHPLTDTPPPGHCGTYVRLHPPTQCMCHKRAGRLVSINVQFLPHDDLSLCKESMFTADQILAME